METESHDVPEVKNGAFSLNLKSHDPILMNCIQLIWIVISKLRCKLLQYFLHPEFTVTTCRKYRFVSLAGHIVLTPKDSYLLLGNHLSSQGNFTWEVQAKSPKGAKPTSISRMNKWNKMWSIVKLVKVSSYFKLLLPADTAVMRKWLSPHCAAVCRGTEDDGVHLASKDPQGEGSSLPRHSSGILLRSSRASSGSSPLP